MHVSRIWLHKYICSLIYQGPICSIRKNLVVLLWQHKAYKQTRCSHSDMLLNLVYSLGVVLVCSGSLAFKTPVNQMRLRLKFFHWLLHSRSDPVSSSKGGYHPYNHLQTLTDWNEMGKTECTDHMQGSICCVTMAKVTNDITRRSTDIPRGHKLEYEARTRTDSSQRLLHSVRISAGTRNVLVHY